MSFSLHRCALFLIPVLVLASAVPTPAELVPRACTTSYSSLVGKLDKNAPDSSNVDGIFVLNRDGGPGSNTVRSVVSFPYIPPDATGCMLEIDIPKLPTSVQRGPIANGTATQSDVWLLSNPPRNSPFDFGYIYDYTWNNPPTRDQFVSTTIFTTEFPTGAPFKTFLWSGTCDRILSFEFELSDWQQGSGHVEFFNTAGGRFPITPLGFHMVYNC